MHLLTHLKFLGILTPIALLILELYGGSITTGVISINGHYPGWKVWQLHTKDFYSVTHCKPK